MLEDVKYIKVHQWHLQFRICTPQPFQAIQVIIHIFYAFPEVCDQVVLCCSPVRLQAGHSSSELHLFMYSDDIRYCRIWREKLTAEGEQAYMWRPVHTVYLRGRYTVVHISWVIGEMYLWIHSSLFFAEGSSKISCASRIEGGITSGSHLLLKKWPL